MTPSADHPRCTILIHFSNSQVSIEQAPSPVFFVEAPGRPVFSSSLFPSGRERMARQGAQTLSVKDPHLLAEMRKRLPARHPNIFEMSGLICGRLLPLRPQSQTECLRRAALSAPTS